VLALNQTGYNVIRLLELQKKEPSFGRGGFLIELNHYEGNSIISTP